MKKILQPLKTTLLTLILIVSTGLVTMAATYTATTSGNWSSAGTWGGTAPSFNITGADVVIIPLGIAVTLDGNLIVNNAAASLTVAGSLTGTYCDDVDSRYPVKATLDKRCNAWPLTVGTGGLITSSWPDQCCPI